MLANAVPFVELGVVDPSVIGWPLPVTAICGAAATVSLSTATDVLLLAKVTPVGVDKVAVLEKEPVAEELTVPWTTNVTVLPVGMLRLESVIVVWPPAEIESMPPEPRSEAVDDGVIVHVAPVTAEVIRQKSRRR